jgi:hypothetical protein
LAVASLFAAPSNYSFLLYTFEARKISDRGDNPLSQFLPQKIESVLRTLRFWICTDLPTREAGEKFCKRFNLNTYALVAQALRCKLKLSLHHENVNSKIYVKENFVAKGFFLWLLGIPFGLIVVLWLFGFLT